MNKEKKVNKDNSKENDPKLLNTDIVKPDALESAEDIDINVDEELYIADVDVIEWSAKEFAHTEKGFIWYLGLVVIFGGLMAISYLINRQYLAMVLFALIGVVVAQYANRKPEEKNYRLNQKELFVGDKNIDLDNFKAYYHSEDYGNTVIDFVPKNKLRPVVAIPVPADRLDEIDDLLLNVLPKTNTNQELIDRIARALKF